MSGCGDDDGTTDGAVRDGSRDDGRVLDDAGADGGTDAGSDSGEPHPDYWALAEATHGFTVENLLAKSHSYYESVEDHTWTSEWHCASQIYADAFMVRAGDPSYETYMNNTYYFFMPRLWDTRTADGGYHPRASPTGTGVSREHKYVDDNALTAVAYLEAYEISEDEGTKADYLESVEDIVNWLLSDTPAFNEENGGYWWNNAPGSFETGQPTQSNGLVIQALLGLYEVTRDEAYWDRAQLVKAFLDDELFDEEVGLYSWHTFDDEPFFFTYDNGIMIEAYLLYYRIAEDPKEKAAYLAAAQSLARNMRDVLWDEDFGGFYIHTGDRRLSPVYSGWATQSLLRLYDVDGNPEWRVLARQNVDAINATLRDMSKAPDTGVDTDGYYQGGRPGAPLEEINLGQSAVDQAWMQRVLAMLSTYYPTE